MMKRIALYSCSVFLAAFAVLTTLAQTPGDGATAQPQNRAGRFQQMDKNNDGQISRDEWAYKTKLFDRLDEDKNSLLTREELSAAARHFRMSDRKKHSREKLLLQMDKNNDGMISREEWTHKARGFERLDANQDGLLTQEELKAGNREK